MDSIIVPSGHFRYGADPVPCGNGIFVAAGESPLAVSGSDVYNPMSVRDVPYETLDVLPQDQADTFLREHSTIRVVSLGEFDGYSGVLRRVHDALGVQRPRAVVFPLRGGLKPGVQLEVMGNYEIEPLWLPYTTGGAGSHEDAIRAALDILLHPLEDGSRLMLSVVDTAISGHSARRLGVFLNDWVGARPGRSMDCHFNILYDPTHPNHSYPAEADEIRRPSSDRARFRLFTFPGPALILEDWAEALGYRVEFNEALCTVKPSVRAGRALLRGPDGIVSFIESERLDYFFDQRIAAALSENILTDPVLQYQRDVCWPEYTHR